MILTVTMRDVREVKLCAGGARAFAKRHELDWSKFLAEGIPAEVLEQTGDAFALAAVENARKRWELAKRKQSVTDT